MSLNAGLTTYEMYVGLCICPSQLLTVVFCSVDMASHPLDAGANDGQRQQTFQANLFEAPLASTSTSSASHAYVLVRCYPSA